MERSQRERRRIKLPKPGLQLRIVGSFAALAALGFLIQSLLLGMFLAETSARMPEGGSHLMAELPGLPIRLLLATLGLVLPLVFAVGVLITFRVAGPIYRFEQYLSSVARGEQLGPCRLRKGDELVELCEIVNRATEPLRTGPMRAPDPDGSEEYPEEHPEAHPEPEAPFPAARDEEGERDEGEPHDSEDLQEGMRAAG